MPFADASFDSVLALWMLYHVADQRAVLHELNRVKSPGGWLIAATNSESETRMNELISSALSATLGRHVDSFVRPLDFTAESGAQVLSKEFASCEMFEWEVRFAISSPQPVVFRFTCPNCGVACKRSADDAGLALLLRAGAAVELPG